MSLGYPFLLLTNIQYGIYVFLLTSNIPTPSLLSISFKVLKGNSINIFKKTKLAYFTDIYLLQRTGSHAYGLW